MPVLRIVKGNKVAQDFQAQRLFLERMVYIRTVIIYPDFFGPGIWGGRLIIKEQHIGFYVIGIR